MVEHIDDGIRNKKNDHSTRQKYREYEERCLKCLRFIYNYCRRSCNIYFRITGFLRPFQGSRSTLECSPGSNAVLIATAASSFFGVDGDPAPFVIFVIVLSKVRALSFPLCKSRSLTANSRVCEVVVYVYAKKCVRLYVVRRRVLEYIVKNNFHRSCL